MDAKQFQEKLDKHKEGGRPGMTLNLTTKQAERLADELERLQTIEIAASNLVDSAGPLLEYAGREFVGTVEMDMLLSALHGPDEEMMDD